MLKCVASVGIMKKVSANVLVLLMLAPLFLWLMIPDAQSSLPACCRKDGKHHCAMMGMMEHEKQDSSTALRDSSSICPNRSKLAVPSASSFAAPPVSGIAYAQLATQPFRIVQILASARISEARSHLKRGPPALA
jgi:hypothetical protein